jgi:hypothetical protein
MLSIPYQQQLKAIAKINPAIGAAINTAELVGPLVTALVKAVSSSKPGGQVVNYNPGSAGSRNGGRKPRQKRGKNVQGLNVIVPGGYSGAVNALQGSAAFNYNARTDRMTISHTEILSVIDLGQGGIGRQIIPVNANMTSWLQTESQRFGRWRPKSISLKYLPNCSTNITGTIVMAPFHDPLSDDEMSNAGFNSLMSTSGAVSGSLWSSSIPLMKWDCSTLGQEWFEVLDPAPTTAQQILGDMYVMATSDTRGLLGRIQISYTMEFAYNRMELVADEANRFSVTSRVEQRAAARLTIQPSNTESPPHQQSGSDDANRQGDASISGGGTGGTA